MSAPYICADCGGPIDPGRGLIDDAGVFYHAEVNECIAALKADRDRYRGVLVALLEADRALKRTKAEQHKAYRGTVPHSGPILDSQMRALYDAAVAHNDAAEAHGRALNAAIAAVEEER